MRDYTWTFFLLDIPDGAAGGNIHVRVASEAKISGEIYARYGGFPSLSNWDYFYANSTSNSNGSMFFKLYDASDKSVSFYIIYARGGTWSFGLRHPISNRRSSIVETSMSISLERCPEKCSSHGACKSVLDSSGLTFYRFVYDDSWELSYWVQFLHAINLPFSVSAIVIGATEALIAVLNWFLLQVKHCVFVTFGLMPVSLAILREPLLHPMVFVSIFESLHLALKIWIWN